MALSCIVCEIYRGKKTRNFYTPPAFSAPRKCNPVGISRRCLTLIKKLKWLSYHMMMNMMMMTWWRKYELVAHSMPLFDVCPSCTYVLTPLNWLIEPIVHNSSTIMCCFDCSSTEVIELSQLVGNGPAHNVYKSTRWHSSVSPPFSPSNTLWVKKHTTVILGITLATVNRLFVAQLC